MGNPLASWAGEPALIGITFFLLQQTTLVSLSFLSSSQPHDAMSHIFLCHVLYHSTGHTPAPMEISDSSMCMRMCMCASVCVHVHLCLHVHVQMSIHVWMRTLVCMCVQVHWHNLHILLYMIRWHSVIWPQHCIPRQFFPLLCYQWVIVGTKPLLKHDGNNI